MNTKGQGIDQTTEPIRRQGKNYLFAMAIDHYRHSPPLFNCVRDVERIISLLHQDYQFEAENTFTLFNEAATEKNIFDTFKRLVQTIKPEDNLLILYSGHGEFEADIEEGYWIPVDAQLGDFSDYVSNSRIVKYLKAIEAHHILLIVDSCFSGTLFAQRNAGPATTGHRLDDIPSRWLITAGRNEVVSDGKPGDHSPFADNIIYFLENNPETSLSVADLSNAVVNAVIYNSRQTPRGEPLQDVGHRGGQFFFHRKGAIPVPVRPGVGQTHQSPTFSTVTFGSSETRTSSRRYWLIGSLAALVAVILFGIYKFTSPARQAFDRPVDTAVNPSGLPIAEEDAIAQEDAFIITPTEKASKEPPEEVPDTAPKTTITRVEQAWLAAQKTDTEAAYRRFIERFPKSKWVTEAEQKIAGQYRYTLLFSPVLKGSDRLEIHFSNGKPPYQIKVVKPNDETIEKVWDSAGPFYLDLGTVSKKDSRVQVIKIIVTDYNFKKKGQMMPVY